MGLTSTKYTRCGPTPGPNQPYKMHFNGINTVTSRLVFLVPDFTAIHHYTFQDICPPELFGSGHDYTDRPEWERYIMIKGHDRDGYIFDIDQPTPGVVTIPPEYLPWLDSVGNIPIWHRIQPNPLLATNQFGELTAAAEAGVQLVDRDGPVAMFKMKVSGLSPVFSLTPLEAAVGLQQIHSQVDLSDLSNWTLSSQGLILRKKRDHFGIEMLVTGDYNALKTQIELKEFKLEDGLQCERSLITIILQSFPLF